MQIKTGLASIGEDKIRKMIIAYEPIWAIGTGKTATPEQAEEVCEHIRAVIRKLYGAKVARAISILYGGSMNEKNAYDLLAQPDIDGGLIGGASLVPEKFVKIIRLFPETVTGTATRSVHGFPALCASRGRSLR